MQETVEETLVKTAEKSIVEQIREGRARSLDLKGAVLSGQDLKNADLSMTDLSGADLSGADLSGARFFRAKLAGARLTRARMTGAELTGADLSGAHMEEVDARNCGLGMARLEKVMLFNANLEGSTLTKAVLSNADMRCVNLRNSRMREVDLKKADLTGADLRNSDMSLSNVSKTTFNNCDLRGCRLRLLQDFESAEWIGVDIRDINFAGAYMLRRFISDQNYLKEFRDRSRFSRVLYYIWWITSDCGRSLTRWFLWILLLAFLFALLYSFAGVDYGDYQTVLSPLYYSIVTLTTLGYGDIVPASLAAQIIAMAEVITGYVMLGGLLSIFNNKIARRAD